MVGRHRFLTGRRLRATMVEVVDICTLTTHLMTPGSAVTPGECLITFDEQNAKVLRDILIEWLG